ncbi:zinc ribbon domain-containing protein [Methanomassiliicoccus luminyensis]|uniref:zinc ribbon domain-containing protein n=1 Tax=Methanomassiliicoccus luminyensis TaxID=1080712 RepID=UPI00036E1D03|nr:zinc ribbon domain-containing protein [Methanomassiliicoccus luminyensis]
MSAETGKCPRCGAESRPGNRYCAGCGYDLTSPMSEPVRQSASWQSSEGAKARIADIIRRRGQSDEVLSDMWILLPILALGVSIVAVVAMGLRMATAFSEGFDPNSGLGPFWADIAVLAIASLVSMVLFLVLNYKLLKRQYEHIAREAALRRALIDFLRAKGEERGAGQNVYQYVQAMEAIDREGVFNEKQRDPLLWTLAPLIPIVGGILWYYSMWFLTEYTPHHDRRWVAFAQNAQYAGSQVGMELSPPRPAVPERSTVLYLILTFLFGVFAVYWYWVIIKDYNEHFRAEWEFEDRLLGEIQRF